MKDRRVLCSEYQGVPNDKAKSGEVCKHFHLLSFYCKLYECECMFSLMKNGHEVEWNFIKDFGLVYDK